MASTPASDSSPEQGEYDFVIIGSGFGGSVTAMRLAQKGYRIAVLETGKRLRPADFPNSNRNLPRYFWLPMLRWFGPQRITFLKGVSVLHGTGVGGGSLVYAATLLKPDASVLRSTEWPAGVDWEKELDGPYREASRMLGVTENPFIEDSDRALAGVARRMGVGDTFHPTRVGIHFGAETAHPDPYFAGEGPDRHGCRGCGGCMIGCRFGAKNSLDHNYLYFAEKSGTRVIPETSARAITPLSGGGYTVTTVRSTSWLRRAGPIFRTRNVVLAAGVLGSIELLLRNRDELRTLPQISPRLGTGVRTNGESLLAVTSFDERRDFSKGIAIGASFHPDADTKIEACRYPSGSGTMRFMGVPLTGPGNAITRPLRMLGLWLVRFPRPVRALFRRDWARHTVILLVMQTLNHTIRLGLGRTWLSFFRRELAVPPGTTRLPSYLPVAQDAARAFATEIDGEPQNVFTEVIFRTPATAHILGGCAMGRDASEGVVSLRHEVFGHPGLFVCDGSTVPANLGVNPSLTISAIAERFAAQFPIKRLAAGDDIHDDSGKYSGSVLETGSRPRGADGLRA